MFRFTVQISNLHKTKFTYFPSAKHILGKLIIIHYEVETKILLVLHWREPFKIHWWSKTPLGQRNHRVAHPPPAARKFRSCKEAGKFLPHVAPSAKLGSGRQKPSHRFSTKSGQVNKIVHVAGPTPALRVNFCSDETRMERGELQLHIQS